MRITFLIFIAAAILSGCFPKSEIHPTPEAFENYARIYNKNVVKITTEYSYGEPKSERGFGFVIGEKGKKLYIVTAKHVIQQKDDGDDSSVHRNIYVEFYSYGRKILAKEDPKIADVFDLALIETDLPFSDYTWEKGCYDNAKRGDYVWFIGRQDDGWYVPPEPGVVEKEPLSTDHTYTIKSEDVRRGTSGAPLLKSGALIGMIFQNNPLNRQMFALIINAIREIIEKQLKLDLWQLYDCQKEKHISVRINHEAQKKEKDEQETEFLLKNAESYFKKGDYIFESKDKKYNSAFYCYQKVLMKDPLNPYARGGVRRILDILSKSLDNIQQEYAKIEKERINNNFKPDEKIEVLEKMVDILKNIRTVCQECIRFQKDEEKDEDEIFFCKKTEVDGKRKFEGELVQTLKQAILILTEEKKHCEASSEKSEIMPQCNGIEQKLKKYEIKLQSITSKGDKS